MIFSNDIDFRIFYKTTARPDSLESWGDYDLFVSAFNLSERVSQSFLGIRSNRKVWVILPEYKLSQAERPSEGEVVELSGDDEAACVVDLYDKINFENYVRQGRVLVDCTGLIRPHFMALLLMLSNENFKAVDIMYSEPAYYVQAEETEFSGPNVVTVRPIRGFEGSPNVGAEEHLVIGGGYESHLLAHLGYNKDSAKKTLILGFPSNRPEMYQESVLRAQRSVESLGAQDARFWLPAPANDPYQVANVLLGVLGPKSMSPNWNVYLAPVGPKPQALGFFIFFQSQLCPANLSMLYPYTFSYKKDSATGFTRAWKYTLEIENLKKLRNQPT